MKTKILIISVILTALFGSITAEVYARYCNNPYCAMCNRIFGYMPGYGPQRFVTEKKNTLNKPEIDTSLESTPYEVVDVMLKLVDPKPNDILYDLGCGDGRILIAAKKQYECRTFGIEINDKTIELARKNIRDSGVDSVVIKGDTRTHKIDGADIITMYLFPESMPKNLAKKVKPGVKIISLGHKIPEIEADEITTTINNKRYTFYLWVAPFYNFTN